MIKTFLILNISIFFFINSSICYSQSLYDTLSKAYESSPLLRSNRLKLEAINEELAKALSKNRPHINLYGSIGSDETTTVNTANLESTTNNKPKSVTLEVQQNIYDFGRTRSLINIADNSIFAERADLRNQEQEILLEATIVYLDLLASIEINNLAKNNSALLLKHFQAINEKFNLGEATSTDLSIAKARYLRARSDEIKSRGDIEKERSKYFSIIGTEAPKKLFFPKIAITIPNNLKDITSQMLKENPTIMASGFRKKLSFIKVSSAASELLPSLNLNLSAQNAWAPNTFFDEYENYKMELNFKFPLYSGGYNYSNVRQKRKEAMQSSKILDYNIKKALKEVEILWIDFNSLKAQTTSINAAVKANEMAVEGVRKENEVGSRTLLDVLDAEQELLEEKVEAIKVKKNKFEITFNLIAYMGKLSSSDLNLNVSIYDYDKNYFEVKNKWLGFED